MRQATLALVGGVLLLHASASELSGVSSSRSRSNGDGSRSSIARPRRAEHLPPLAAPRRSAPAARRGGALRWSAAALAEKNGASADLVALGGGGGWAAAGWVGGLALASEALQIVNTVIGVWLLNRLTGATGVAELVEAVASFTRTLGWFAYPAFALTLQFITILPLMSAILFIILAGSLFGLVRGTILVSLSLSSAAAISAAVSRRVAKARGFSINTLEPRAAAVDAAIARDGRAKWLLLVSLLRLSPVLPFTFSNYLAGLTSVPVWVFFLGTLLGTLPTQAVYVGAGAIGRHALQGGVKLPKSIVALGVLATVAAIVIIGRVATQTLAKLDLEGSAPAASGKLP